MLYPCKVMRAGDAPHEWIDAAAFGWYEGDNANSNDGPAIEAPSSSDAVLAALNTARDMRVNLGAVNGEARVCAMAREGAETFVVEAVILTTVRPTSAAVQP